VGELKILHIRLFDKLSFQVTASDETHFQHHNLSLEK